MDRGVDLCTAKGYCLHTQWTGVWWTCASLNGTLHERHLKLERDKIPPRNAFLYPCLCRTWSTCWCMGHPEPPSPPTALSAGSSEELTTVCCRAGCAPPVLRGDCSDSAVYLCWGPVSSASGALAVSMRSWGIVRVLDTAWDESSGSHAACLWATLAGSRAALPCQHEEQRSCFKHTWQPPTSCLKAQGTQQAARKAQARQWYFPSCLDSIERALTSLPRLAAPTCTANTLPH